MSYLEKFAKLINNFEDLFMTNHSCNACGREIPDGSKFQLCNDCLNSLDKIEGNICSKCGERLPQENLKVCDHCKDTKYNFVSNRSCFYYNDIASKIIKNLKYNLKKYIAKDIAKMMLLRYEFFENVDILTYVPISKTRKRERGFNQSEEIAKEIGRALNLPVKNLLIKKDGGRHQADLNMSQRLTNPVNSFEIFKENKNLISGKRILIVDDVFTTGSTLSECAKVLNTLKPKSICTVTFAKTKFNSLN